MKGKNGTINPLTYNENRATRKIKPPARVKGSHTSFLSTKFTEDVLNLYFPRLITLVKKHRHRKDINPDECRYSIVTAHAILKKEFPDIHICVKTLYNWLHADKISGLTKEDALFYPRKETEDEIVKKSYSLVYERKRASGDSIESRPDEVLTREEFGDFEGDTMYSIEGDTTTYLSLIERKTRMQFLVPTSRRTARCIHGALKKIMKEIPIIKSITFEPEGYRAIAKMNGSEFNNIKTLEKIIRKVSPMAKIYYAHPFASNERGSNERNHLTIRRMAIRGEPLRKYTLSRVKRMIDFINETPRKILDWDSSKDEWQVECLLLSCCVN